MDKYDKEIEEIRVATVGKDVEGFKDVIMDHWGGRDDLPFELFKFCSPDGDDSNGVRGSICGCLTQVHNGNAEAYTDELTHMIRNDDRIHGSPGDIKSIEELQVYAEYQRLMDKTIRQPQETA